MVKCVRIERRFAEKVFEHLKEIEAVDHEYVVSKDEHYVYIPVRKQLWNTDEYDIVECTPKKRVRKRSLRDFLLEKNYKGYVRAFDVIGEIAIVEIPEGVKEEEIAKGILEIYPRIRTVYAKCSGRNTDFRLYELRCIYGEDKSLTSHKENCCVFQVDVKRTYFSPRDANERKVVVDYIKKKNFKRISVFFAGVGPFVIQIAKNCPHCEVYGIELNKTACELFRKNIVLNRVKNAFVIEGDVRDKYKEIPSVECVVMPLPRDAELFIDEALKTLQKEGVIILYLFVQKEKRNEKIDELVSKLKERYREKDFELLEIKEVKSYSPKEVKCRIILGVRESLSEKEKQR